MLHLACVEMFAKLFMPGQKDPEAYRIDAQSTAMNKFIGNMIQQIFWQKCRKSAVQVQIYPKWITPGEDNKNGTRPSRSQPRAEMFDQFNIQRHTAG